MVQDGAREKLVGRGQPVATQQGDDGGVRPAGGGGGHDRARGVLAVQEGKRLLGPLHRLLRHKVRVLLRHLGKPQVGLFPPRVAD